MNSHTQCWAVLLCAIAFLSSTWAQEWKPPTSMKKLANGLTVVVSEDHSAPTFGLGISYGIGFRLEPEGRTGFAHLFEHMMFEGTPNAPKGVLMRVIEGGGGRLNGDTRYDHTEYIETAPISAITGGRRCGRDEIFSRIPNLHCRRGRRQSSARCRSSARHSCKDARISL